MNFDATQISIRERSFSEILDLALKVCCAHAGPLALATLVGVLPWAVLNALVLLVGFDLLSDTLWNNPGAYFYWMLILVAVEAPLATAPITLYLGQVTFSGAGNAGRIAKDYFLSLPQMLLTQGFVRGLAALPLITLLLPYLSWPYLSELILLERNPLFAGKAKNGVKRLTTRKRSKNLHRNNGGDLFVRWLVSALLGALMVGITIGGIHSTVEWMFGYQLTTTINLAVTFPLVLWMWTAYFAVVRFLSYLDLRIKREGWEVELTMRAEAARMTRFA